MTTEPTSYARNQSIRLDESRRVRLRRTYVAAATLGLLAFVHGREARATDYTLTVDASKPASGNPHFWSTCVGTGTASLTLRSDLQTHYQIANRELGMERVRGHGVLNDDMGIYKGGGSYDFSKFDTYLAAIAAANMRPIMELSFMPTALASAGDSKNPPKDYAAYTALIKAVVQHAVEKFGAEDVAKWYWEVWNEPNYSGFWTGTMDDYLKLYDAAVAGATAALPNIVIGGPATTQGSTSQMTQFIDHVKSANVHFNFVSSHAYAGGAAETAPADFALTDNNGRVDVITTAGFTTDTIKSLNTEWNSSYSGQGGNMAGNCVSMDTHANAPFVLKTVKLLTDKVVGDKPPLDVFSYWTISDVFDESSGPSGSYILSKTPNGTLPFGQVFGLMTFQGMRKAAYNGFKMLNYLGDKRLTATGGTGTANGVDALVTANGDGSEVQIIVYNYYSTLATTGTDNVTVTLSNLPFAGKEGYVTRFAVDETHTNPYSVWAGQNKPSAPTEAQWEEMHKAQHLMPVDPIAKQTFEATYSATFAVPKQGAAMLILGLKRPLTGRNALLPLEGEDFDGQSGLTKEDSADSTMGQSVSVTANGWAYFENVDYTDTGVDTVQLRVKTAAATTVELHAETATGTLLGTCALTSTSDAWATQTCKLSQPVTGVAKLYVVFGGALHLNWLQFQLGDAPPMGTGGAGGMSGMSGAGGSATAGINGGGSAGQGTAAAAGTMPASGGGSGMGTGGAGASAGAGGGVNGGMNGVGGGAGTANGAGGRSAASGGMGPSNSGASGSPAPASSDDSSGCGCRVAGRDRPQSTLPMLGLLLGALGLRRRRASVRGALTWASWLGFASLAAACSSKEEGNGGSSGECTSGACAGHGGTGTAGSVGSGASAGAMAGGTGGTTGGSTMVGGRGGSGGTTAAAAGIAGTAGTTGGTASGSSGAAGTQVNGGTGGVAGMSSSGGTGGMPEGAGMGGAAGAAVTLTLPYLVTSGPSAYWKTDAALTEVTSGTADVTVNDGAPAQTWEGFGSAFNEMGWNYLSMLSETDRKTALDLLFAPDGINFAWGRIPMGATDYAMDRYTLDETAGDTALADFSIERDEGKLIPYIKAAQAIKPSLHFWSSPWTPPTWLKDGPFNDDFPFDGGKAKTDDATLTTLANYFVKFIQAYGEQGLKIELVSPQNEPGYSGTYPTCAWDPSAYANFVGKFLGPAFTTANLQVKIMLGTFNGGTGDTDIVSTVMADATAKNYIKVLGYQWGMDGSVESAKSYGVPIWQTEHKCGNYPWMTYDKDKAPNDQLYAVESWGLIRDWIKKGVTAYSTWNLVLDTIGLGIDAERVWPQNALLTVDTSTKKLIITPTYYVFRHLSRFIVPGATVVGTTGGDALAFKNPDGSIVAVAYNSGAEKTATIALAGKKLQFTMPANGWATVVAK
jgi:glucosylceramidase